MTPPKTALIWPYKYDFFYQDWAAGLEWVCNALISKGYTILKHPRFGFNASIKYCDYDYQEDVGVVIYNHCDLNETFFPEPTNGVDFYPPPTNLNVGTTWFLKGTVPTKSHFTLDELGYGSYSSVTYERPPTHNIPYEDVNSFFETKVRGWVEKNECKWGEEHFSDEVEVEEEDFILVLGQNGADSVLNRQDTGSYYERLKFLLNEITKITDIPIVVKMHPYTNGKDYVEGRDHDWESEIADGFESICPRSHQIKAYRGFSSIHKFLPKARCVLVGNSGSGFEAMMHGKPIISFCKPEYHWITYDLRKACELPGALDTDSWFRREESDTFLYWYMEEHCVHDEKSAFNRVDELISNSQDFIRVNS